MASTIFYGMILLIVVSSFAMFVNADGRCPKGYSKDFAPPCQCKYRPYTDCPLDCNVNDCYRPIGFDCDDLGADDEIPYECHCSDYYRFDCPKNCRERDCRAGLQWYWILVICLVCALIVCLCCMCCIAAIRR